MDQDKVTFVHQGTVEEVDQGAGGKFDRLVRFGCLLHTASWLSSKTSPAFRSPYFTFIFVTVFLAFGDSAKDFFDKLFRSEFGQQCRIGKFDLVRFQG